MPQVTGIPGAFSRLELLLRIGFARKTPLTSLTVLAGRFCAMDFTDKVLNLNLAVIQPDYLKELTPF